MATKATVDVSLRADVRELINGLKEVEGVTAAEARKMVNSFKKTYKDAEKAAKIAAQEQAKAQKSVTQTTTKETEKQIGNITDIGQKALTELGGVFGDLEGVFDLARVSSEKTGFGMVTAFTGATAAIGIAVLALQAYIDGQKEANRAIADSAESLEGFTRPEFQERLNAFAEEIDLIDTTAKRLAAEGFMAASDEAIRFERAMLAIESVDMPGIGEKVAFGMAKAMAIFGENGDMMLKMMESLGEAQVNYTRATGSLTDAQTLLSESTAAIGAVTLKTLSPLDQLAEKEKTLTADLLKAKNAIQAAIDANREAGIVDGARAQTLQKMAAAVGDLREELKAGIEAERASIQQKEAAAAQAKRDQANKEKDAEDDKNRREEERQARTEAANLAKAQAQALALLRGQEIALGDATDRAIIQSDARREKLEDLLTLYPELETASAALALEEDRLAQELDKIAEAKEKADEQLRSEAMAEFRDNVLGTLGAIGQLAAAFAGFADMQLQTIENIANANRESQEAAIDQANEKADAEVDAALAAGEISAEVAAARKRQNKNNADQEKRQIQSLTREQEKAARKAYNVKQAAAITNVLISGAEAYAALVAALAWMGPLAPATALGIAGASTSLGLAMVASVPPPEFPTGSNGSMLSPDHSLIGVQEGEAVLSRRAVDVLGEEAIDHLNKGVTMGGSMVANIVLDRRIIGRAISELTPNRRSARAFGQVPIYARG